MVRWSNPSKLKEMRLKLRQKYSFLLSENMKIRRLNNVKQKVDSLLMKHGIRPNYTYVLTYRQGSEWSVPAQYISGSVFSGNIQFLIYAHLVGMNRRDINKTFLHEYAHGIFELVNYCKDKQVINLMKDLVSKFYQDDIYSKSSFYCEDRFCELFAIIVTSNSLNSEIGNKLQLIIERYNFLLNGNN